MDNGSQNFVGADVGVEPRSRTVSTAFCNYGLILGQGRGDGLKADKRLHAREMHGIDTTAFIIRGTDQTFGEPISNGDG